MSRQRRKLKISIVALMIALTIGAIAATAAEGEWEWQLEHQQLSGLTTSEAISGTGGVFTLATTLLGVKTSVSCESMELTSSKVIPEGKGASTLKLSKCHVVEPAGCTVTEPINLKSNTEIFTLTTSTKLFNRYTPSETKFATLKISGCLFAGEYGIEGSFGGEFEGGEERVKEPITFSPKISEESKTNLTVAGKAATLEGKFEMAAAGPFAGKQIGGSPVTSKPANAVSFKKTKKGNSELMTITHTVVANKDVKFKAVTIAGGAGVFSPDKDTCSGNQYKKGESCIITVKFAPTAAVKYEAYETTPWETADGEDFGLKIHKLIGEGEN